MGKKMPAAPAAPDPYAVAAAQGQANLETAIGNTAMSNANEIGPGGRVNYEQTGTKDIGGGKLVPTYTKTTTLAPDEARLYDQQNGLNLQLGQVASNQLQRLGDALSQPLTADGLPAAQTSLSMPSMSRVGSGPQLATGYDQSMVPTSFGATSRNVQYGDTTFGDAGEIQRSVGDGSRAATTFGDAGPIQRSVGPDDFSADRLRVEQALTDRLNPQLDRSRAALETQLVNQGLVRGTAAFNSAMDEETRRANDAHLGVIAQGGQEQSRLFADALSAGSFANSAQAQDFGQQQARGEFGNNAVGQNFSQDLAAGTFANSSQDQAFRQAKERGLFGLGAIAQNNAGQAQEYGQLEGRAGYARDATVTNNAASAAAAGFGNDALQTMYGNGVSAASFNNAAGQQEFANDNTAAEFGITARERALQERSYLRSQPLNDISALTSGIQINVPQFSPFRAGSAEAAPIASSVYSSAQLAQDAWKTQVQANAAKMGSLYSLGGAVAGAAARSDRRLKRDIRRLDITMMNGLPLYSYRYLDGEERHVGVMADEAELVAPHAVFTMSNGFKAVAYAGLH